MKAQPVWSDPLVLSSLAGTTTHRLPELLAALQQRASSHQRRAENARQSGQKRSDRLRRAIRSAAGLEPREDGIQLVALHLGLPGWPAAVAAILARDPLPHGLTVEEARQGLPCDDVIRAEWSRLTAERSR